MKHQSNKYLKFTTVAFQMIIIISGAAFLGLYLDQTFKSQKVFTIICSLLGVFIGMYLIIKEAMDMIKR